MSTRTHWQSGTALVTSLGILAGAALPFTLSAPGNASTAPTIVSQLFPQPQRTPATTGVRLPVGTVIPTEYQDAERVVVTPQETIPLTVTVSRNVRSSAGALLIPAGSTVKGEVRPANGGSQFVAQELQLSNGRTYAMDASSRVVTRKETIRRGANTGSILKGAAIGAAAAAVLSEIFGDIDLGEVLGGAGIGALGGILLGRRSVEVVVIDSDTDLSLRLNSSLALR